MIRLRVTIDVESDFHIGTGSGAGRTVDSVVLRDERGAPVIPASSLKGLARWHAEQLLLCQPLEKLAGGPVADAWAASRHPLIERLFGAMGAEAGHVFFGDARWTAPPSRELPPTVIHGRSARDRISRRARPKALFHVEDAPAATFVSELTSTLPLAPPEWLLLLLGLRRIDALGGQRRRGKGRARVSVEVLDGPEPFRGLKVPGDDGAFRSLCKKLLHGETLAATESPRPVPAPSLSAERSQAERSPIVARRVLARALQSFVITDSPETANIIGTSDYVPGSSWRGALAWHLLRSCGWSANDAAFRRMFSREEVRFGPLYPCRADDRFERSMPFRLPRSVLTCKYCGGSPEESDEFDDKHGLHDVLLGASALVECRTCGAALVPFGEFAQWEGTDRRKKLIGPRLDRLSLQRTEIDDVTLSSSEGRLYSTEAIARGTWLAGYVWGPADLIAVLEQAVLEQAALEAGKQLTLRVGKSRTRGHGELAVELRTPEPGQHATYPQLLPRSAAAVAPDVHEGPFTLTLYSDAIGVDRWLRPITWLDPEGANLWELLEGCSHLAPRDVPFANQRRWHEAHLAERDGYVAPSPIVVERGYCAVRHVGGFHGLAGVPRSADEALVAGSAWRLNWRPEATHEERRDAWNRLQRAVAHGIGLRRGEGFGAVLIDFPLHGLDQMPTAEGRSVAFPSTADTAFFDWPANEAGLHPQRPAVTRWPDKLTPLLDAVPPVSQLGFGRLLLTLSQEPDPPAALQAAVDECRSRAKVHGKDKAEEPVLTWFAAKNDGDWVADDYRQLRMLLNHSAERLVRAKPTEVRA